MDQLDTFNERNDKTTQSCMDTFYMYPYILPPLFPIYPYNLYPLHPLHRPLPPLSSFQSTPQLPQSLSSKSRSTPQRKIPSKLSSLTPQRKILVKNPPSPSPTQQHETLVKNLPSKSSSPTPQRKISSLLSTPQRTLQRQDPMKIYRPNFPRDKIAILLDWLLEHCDNPYPTRAEKIILSKNTGISFKSVSYW